LKSVCAIGSLFTRAFRFSRGREHKVSPLSVHVASAQFGVPRRIFSRCYLSSGKIIGESTAQQIAEQSVRKGSVIDEACNRSTEREREREREGGREAFAGGRATRGADGSQQAAASFDQEGWAGVRGGVPPRRNHNYQKQSSLAPAPNRLPFDLFPLSRSSRRPGASEFQDTDLSAGRAKRVITLVSANVIVCIPYRKTSPHRIQLLLIRVPKVY